MSKLLGRLVEGLLAHPVKVLLGMGGAVAASVLWLVLFSPLKLDTNFSSLLPGDLPCVLASKRISDRVGSTDYLYVAIESRDVEANKAIAQEIATKLEKLPEIDWVSTREDKSFFRKNRLLYLKLEDLETIVGRAKARVAYEKKVANPFYVQLDDEERAPDISFDDVMEKYQDKLARYGVRGILEPTSGSVDEKDGTKEKKPADLADFIASPDGSLFTVVARPKKSAVDMAFGRALVKKVEGLIASSDPHRVSGMRVEVAGSYRNRNLEYNNIVKDIFTSLGTSLGLILLIVVVFFRRLRAVALIFIPLVVGILFTVAATALVLGRLNMVTALIFAVLLGLGIDFGVHMTSRYLDERGRGRSLSESLTMAIVNTGRALVTAGLTTAGAMAVLMLASFKGFSEFGLIATMGILICLLVYVVMIPTMAVLMERVMVPKPWRKKSVDLDSLRGGLGGGKKLVVLGLSAVAVVTVAGIFFARQVGFEYNFRKLGSAKSVSCSIKYGKTLSQSSSPVVALMDSPEDARVLTRHLEEIVDGDVEQKNLLRNAFSIFSFIPDNQPQKLKLLATLRGTIDEALGLKKLKSGVRDRLEELRQWTFASQISLQSLPDWVTAKFAEKDGTIGTMVYLFPRLDEFHVDRMALFYDQYGEIAAPGGGKVHPAASGFILVEVIRAVKEDGALMMVVATVVVLVVLILDLRRISRAVLVGLPLLLGMVWTLGIMGALDIKLGLYNMLVLPTLLGIGIDASVHLFHTYEEFGKGSLPYVMRTTAVAVFVAAATTGVGFVGMLMVSHMGLRSIGTLAVIGISACLVAALVVEPLLLALLEQFGKMNHNIKKDV